MQGGWHDFDYWRERQRDLLGEAEGQRLVRTQRPDWTERLEVSTEEPERAAWIWEQKTHG